MLTYDGDHPSNPVFAVSSWLEGVLTGKIATELAVITVASVSLLMLSGHIHLRRSARVLLGCFIVFGASTIAAGIHSAIMGGGGSSSSPQMNPPPYSPLAAPATPQPAPAATDPYAGAAVQRR